MLALLIPIIVILIIIVYGFIVIKRHFIDKKEFRGGTEAAVLGSTLELLDRDKRTGTEQIQNMQEEKLEDDNGDKNIKGR